MVDNVTLRLETWNTVWPEVSKLAHMHFDEVDGGVEPKRKLNVSNRIMQMLSDAGVLKIITARVNGDLVGYYTWQVFEDPESEGLLIAQQGAWFVNPSMRFKSVGLRLWMKSVAELRLMGVKNIFPHHRMQGSGAGLGKFFERMGAKKIQQTYSLWIGN